MNKIVWILSVWIGFFVAGGPAFIPVWAFDYEHPEKLSAGDCWVTLSDGRVVIRSGRDCPRSRTVDEVPQSESEPFWNNIGSRNAGGAEPAAPEGNAIDASDGIVTDSPWIPNIPYSRGCGRPRAGVPPGHHDGHKGPGHPGSKLPHPVQSASPPLPPDQQIFQQIYKNAYPAMNSKTTGP